MIVAGEASGDMYGSCLAVEIRRLVRGARILGVGGHKMRAANVELLYDSSDWSAIGVAEALRVAPRLWRVLSALKRQILSDPPDLLIPIDFGAFNVRLLRGLPDSVRTLYFVPPGSWNRSAEYRTLGGLVDHAVSPFPWAVDGLSAAGISAHFYGHPLLDVVKQYEPRTFRDRFGFSAGQKVIGLFPGSRRQEIRYNLPVLLASAALLAGSEPSTRFAMAPASSFAAREIERQMAALEWVDCSRVQEEPVTGDSSTRSSLAFASEVEGLMSSRGIRVPDHRLKIAILTGGAREILAGADCAVAASGTVTLEAAILGCPVVIVYRGSRLTALEYRLLGRHVRYIGLPNILLQRKCCPELLQGDAEPGRIAGLVRDLAGDTPARRRMLSDFEEIRRLLGTEGAIGETARLAADLLARPSVRRG